jgi:predicted N-formylglutamate amidohydrolase
MHVDIEIEDAVEIVRGAADAPVLLTCEHASERLPEPWTWPEPDRWIVGTHWAYDIGAADLTRDMAEDLRANAVLSRFSRLLADPNRDETAADLCRRGAEGREVQLNHAVDAHERERRLARLHRPYHAAIDRELGRASASVVLSIHTFTPVYEGQPRMVEIGVLFDEEIDLAERFARVIAAAGFVTRMNEPYSGREGLIYSAHRHAKAHGRRAVELEVRQDLAVEAVVRRNLCAAIRPVLAELSPS